MCIFCAQKGGINTEGGIGARFKFRRPLLLFFFNYFFVFPGYFFCRHVCETWDASTPRMPTISGAVARIINETLASPTDRPADGRADVRIGGSRWLCVYINLVLL